MIRKYLSLGLLQVVTCATLAQKFTKQGVETFWNKRRITLNDKTLLIGEIHHDELMNFISFRANDTTGNQEMIEKSEILLLEYFDNKERAFRRYIGISYVDSAGKQERNFYELIKEFSDFVVLSKKDHVASRKVLKYIYRKPYEPTVTKIYKLATTQFERIYFFANDDEPELILTIEHDYDSDFKKTERKVSYLSNTAIFPKYLGFHWHKVEQYLKDNRIRLDNKEGIIKALNFYADLLSN